MHKNNVILFNFVFVVKTCSMRLRYFSIPNFMHSFNTLEMLTIYDIVADSKEKSRIDQLHTANDFKYKLRITKNLFHTRAQFKNHLIHITL